MKEDYVSFETAKLLKEKGFNQECDYATSWYAKQYYKNPCVGEWFEGEHYIIEDIDDKYNISYLLEKDVFIPAQTLQMAMKWLRRVHNQIIVPNIRVEDPISGIINCYIVGIWYIPKNNGGAFCYTTPAPYNGYPSFEEACEEGIKYCLENLV